MHCICIAGGGIGGRRNHHSMISVFILRFFCTARCIPTVFPLDKEEGMGEGTLIAR